MGAATAERADAIVGPLPHTAHCQEGNRYGQGEFCSHLERLHDYAVSAAGRREHPWLHEVVRLRLLVEDIEPAFYGEVISEAGGACPICDYDGAPLS